MSETENYHLTLTDSDQTNFLDWRNSINGCSNSNMEKIDEALKLKADISKSVSGVLSASGWSGTKAPYTQNLIVDGLKTDHNGSISLADTASYESRTSAMAALLSVTGQENGKLVISADGVKPKTDIPVIVIILG